MDSKPIFSHELTWVVEKEAFSPAYTSFCKAIVHAGHVLLLWQDEWWETQKIPDLKDRWVIFHGSLGNADRIARELPWYPGAFCNTPAFLCSAWYTQATRWLLHQHWVFTTVRDLVFDPMGVVGHLAVNGQVFVRPDSPLKPFSGRVVSLEGLSAQDLDHGFYYEDMSLPIVVAPVTEVAQEWRFVIVGTEVIAGSGYEANTRTTQDRNDMPWDVAQNIAKHLAPPDPVYIMDLCESRGQIRLLELNPFSGADLYGCDPESVVQGVWRTVIFS